MCITFVTLSWHATKTCHSKLKAVSPFTVTVTANKASEKPKPQPKAEAKDNSKKHEQRFQFNFSKGHQTGGNMKNMYC